MNRRNFLQLATMALAGEGLRRVFPFRVYSFPKEIKVVPRLTPEMVSVRETVYRMYGGAAGGGKRAQLLDRDVSYFPYDANNLDDVRAADAANRILVSIEEWPMEELKRMFPPYIERDYMLGKLGIA